VRESALSEGRFEDNIRSRSGTFGRSGLLGATLDKGEFAAQDKSVATVLSIDQARSAINNYLTFFQNSMSATPWARTELNKILTKYARQNVDTAFEFAQRLAQVKNLQNMVQIQTDYFQTQMKSLSNQAKELAEVAANATADAIGTNRRLF